MGGLVALLAGQLPCVERRNGAVGIDVLSPIFDLDMKVERFRRVTLRDLAIQYDEQSWEPGRRCCVHDLHVVVFLPPGCTRPRERKDLLVMSKAGHFELRCRLRHLMRLRYQHRADRAIYLIPTSHE
ncbi:hypothetical protein WK59_13055 [Burkholderia ubonensis]|nr:hypothetical protein WI84_26270 [Burkholderia ubonensis]KVT84389.1 hypothetical protein WK59_13055 [Burkholderia ubonensis]